MPYQKFQSTHPHEVRRSHCFYFFSITVFQSTHPHEVRHAKCSLSTSTYRFNPRTHTRCDFPPGAASGVPVFQSTHPHEVRLVQQFPCLTIRRFQSTHPHEVRPACPDEVSMAATVSIHAPTRGATFQQHDHRIRLFIQGFNPRTHTRCDIIG